MEAKPVCPFPHKTCSAALVLLLLWKPYRSAKGKGLRELVGFGRMLLAWLRRELQAIGHGVRMLESLCTNPNLNARVGPRSLFSMATLLAHEAATNDKKTAEQVAKAHLGSRHAARLSGRVAIVTGASSGLGKETARVLMQHGCHVVWAVRNLEKSEAALRALREREQLSGAATILKLDLSDLRTVKPFVEAFCALRLPLHYLVLNAGIMAPPGWQPSAQGHESMFATNNLGHFLLAELLLPILRRTGDGRVVVLSSAAAMLCNSLDPLSLPTSKERYDPVADYAVSKACDALHARQLQRDLAGSGVSAVAVHPGVIATGLGQGNDGLVALFYGSSLLSWARRDVETGAATTTHCLLAPEVSQEASQGALLYYNRAPQRLSGILGDARDELCEKLRAVQMDLVKEFR